MRLEVCLKRNNENPAGEAEQEVAGPGFRKVMMRVKEGDSKHAEAHRADRHQAQLHLVAREPSRDESSEANADRDRRHQGADARVA